MARKPTLRRAGGYWYTQAGARDGVYFGRVADVPYKVARARFGEYLAGLSRAPLPTLDLPDRSVAEVCSLHLAWALKHRSKNLFSQRKCLLNGLCNYRIGDQTSIRLPGVGLLTGELRADRLTRAHIEAYLEYRRTTPSQRTGKPFGDKALRHIVVAVKAAWNCHVAESNFGVIRHVISKLADGYATLKALPKAERRRFFEDCLAVHAANRAEYEAVMWPRYEVPEP